MANQGFTFKQFHINQDRCAMKVGTDGVLLGAWAPVAGARRVLDIGTGTGLIALMLAQRSDPECRIDAVELDAEAAAQAAENVLAAPWSGRMAVHALAIQDYRAAPYDLIVSNPPYFPHGLEAECAARRQARHTVTLGHGELLAQAERLLAPGGRFALILPLTEGLAFKTLARENGFQVAECWQVVPRAGKAVNRVLLLLSRESVCESHQTITLYSADNQRTDTFRQLVAPFYLKL